MTIILMTIIIIFLAISVLILLLMRATTSFKIGYYEQAFKNNEDVFKKERFNQIKEVMDAKSIFELYKIK